MATRKKPEPAAEPPAIEYADFVDTETLNPALEAIKAQLGIEGDIECTIHVSLLDADGEGNDAKVWTGNETDYDLEAIAKKFGSGRYRVMGYVKRPDGQRPRAFNRVQGWRLSPEDQARYMRARAAAENPQPEPQAQTSGSDLREAMREMLGQLLPALKQPAVDPLAQMQSLAGILKTMMPAAAPAVAAVDPFTQLAGMLGMMEKLKAITGGNVPPDASASETLLLEAARSILPALATGLQKQTSATPPAQAPQSAPETAALPAPASDQVLSEDEEMNIMQRARMAMFAMQLNAANRAATRGANPAEYAETIYDGLDETDIENFALAPNWFELICEALPACRAHQKWYAGVRDEIIAIALGDGILARDAGGVLTIVDDSGTTGQLQPEGQAHGPAVTGSDTAAGGIEP